MPPSGFSQKAINGLLVFVRENYDNLLQRFDSSSLSESEFLRKISLELEKEMNTSRIKGFEGLLQFLSECYKDLNQEILVGQDKYGRPVVEGKAIQKEIEQINTYLLQFRI